MMDVREARQLFPAAHERVWLNHAAYSPPSTRVRDAMIAAVESQSRGDLKFKDVIDLRRRVTDQAAALVRAAPERVAIVRNTTHGILLAANGLEWLEGDNVVCANVEFPANVYPWLNLERKGVKVRFAPEIGGRIPLAEIEPLIDERTRVVALSFVEFTNGFRNDLPSIGRLCREAGALFVVDAIQGLGALRLDMSECCIDLACAGGHKWLAGPMGIGVACLSERAFESIHPPYVGWLGVREPEKFLHYDLTFAEDARRFDEGAPNLAGLYGLDAALQLILDVGIDVIESRVKRLSDALATGLADLGCRIASPREQAEWSGIVSFSPPAGASSKLFSWFESKGIVTSLRGDLVRAACHYWNDETDVESAVGATREWLDGNATD